jgi:DNA-binding PadR family transcriptional regulator
MRHHHHRHGRSHGRGDIQKEIGYHGGSRRFARDPGDHGGRRRLFDHGDLRFILLSMVAARPAHGYDLIKALEERMGGGYSPSPGVIYPTLTMLEEQGFARCSAEDGKKLYHATPEGEAFLNANQGELDAIQARIDHVARERRVLPDPRIVRAVENLRTALRLRLASGAIPEERVPAIAAAIDAAAAEVERT